MDKLKMHSLDGVERNIELIGKLFPNAITEVMRDGKVEHAIDFDVLRPAGLTVRTSTSRAIIWKC